MTRSTTTYPYEDKKMCLSVCVGTDERVGLMSLCVSITERKAQGKCMCVCVFSWMSVRLRALVLMHFNNDLSVSSETSSRFLSRERLTT